MPEHISKLHDIAIFSVLFLAMWWNADIIIPIVISGFLHLLYTALATVSAFIIIHSLMAGRLIVPITIYMSEPRRRDTDQHLQQQQIHAPPIPVDEAMYGAGNAIQHANPMNVAAAAAAAGNQHQHAGAPAAAAGGGGGGASLRRRTALAGWIVFVGLEEELANAFGNALTRWIVLLIITGVCPIYCTLPCAAVAFIATMLSQVQENMELLLRPAVLLRFRLRIYATLLLAAVLSSLATYTALENSIGYVPPNPSNHTASDSFPIVSPARNHPLMRKLRGEFFATGMHFHDTAEDGSPLPTAGAVPPLWELGVAALHPVSAESRERWQQEGVLHSLEARRRLRRRFGDKRNDATSDSIFDAASRPKETPAAEATNTKPAAAKQKEWKLKTSKGFVSSETQRSASWLDGAFSAITDRHVQTALSLLSIELFSLAARAWTHCAVTLLLLGKRQEELPAPGDTLFYFSRWITRCCEFMLAVALASQALGFKLVVVVASFAKFVVNFAAAVPSFILTPTCVAYGSLHMFITLEFDKIPKVWNDCKNIRLIMSEVGEDIDYHLNHLAFLDKMFASAGDADGATPSSLLQFFSWFRSTTPALTGTRVPLHWQIVVILCAWRFLSTTARWHEWMIIMDRVGVPLTKERVKAAIKRRATAGRGAGMAANNNHDQAANREGGVVDPQLEENRRRRREHEAQLFQRAVSESLERRQRSMSTALDPDDLVCAICLDGIEPLSEGISFRCGHFLHRSCASRYIAGVDPVELARCCQCRRYIFASQSPDRGPPQPPPRAPQPPAAQQPQPQAQAPQPQLGAEVDRQGSPDPVVRE